MDYFIGCHCKLDPYSTLHKTGYSLAIQSLSFSYVCPISCGFVLITGILVPVGTDLGDVENISWIVGGWSIASSVSFSIAGSLSDIFGRRYTIVSGEVLAIVGSVSVP